MQKKMVFLWAVAGLMLWAEPQAMARSCGTYKKPSSDSSCTCKVRGGWNKAYAKKSGTLSYKKACKKAVKAAKKHIREKLGKIISFRHVMRKAKRRKKGLSKWAKCWIHYYFKYKKRKKMRKVKMAKAKIYTATGTARKRLTGSTDTSVVCSMAKTVGYKICKRKKNRLIVKYSAKRISSSVGGVLVKAAFCKVRWKCKYKKITKVKRYYCAP